MESFVGTSCDDYSDEGALHHATRSPGVDINDQDIDHRWSEIVPPHSALTFAVILDSSSSPHDYDDEDRISFSRAQILEDPQRLGELPECFYSQDNDDIWHDSDFPETIPSSRRSSECRHRELLEVKDSYNGLLAPLTPSSERRSLRRGLTHASSTLGGVDVYLKGEAETLAKTHRRPYVYGSLLQFEDGFDLELDRLGTLGCQGKRDHAAQIPLRHKRVSMVLNGRQCRGEGSVSSTRAPTECPVVGEFEWMKREPEPEQFKYVGRRLKKRRRKPSESTCRDIALPQVPELARAPKIVTPANVVPQYLDPVLPQNPKRSLRNVLSFKRLKRRYNEAEPPVEDWILVDEE